MGRWLDWTITEDLTPSEASEVLAIVRDRVIPAVRAIADESDSRPGAPPRAVMGRLFDWMSRKANSAWANHDDTFTLLDNGVRIEPRHVVTPCAMPFVAGEYAGQTVGIQDYAVLGTLAAIASVSGKALLTSGDEFDAVYVAEIIARLESVSGQSFGELGSFTAALAEADNEEPGDKPTP